MLILFKKILSTIVVITSLVVSPSLAFAHEVYVLSPDHIARDISVDSPNPFSIVATNQMQFALWGFISILVVVLVLIFSLTKKVEKFADPFLFRIKKYAPFVARITLGICLMFSAQHGALFGPELPFLPFAGDYTHLLTTILYTIGIALTIGLFTTCGLIQNNSCYLSSSSRIS